MLPAVAVDLGQLVAPAHTVLVTQECQNGIIGEQSPMRDLAESVAPMKAEAGRLAAAARAAGVQVIHCLALRRPDGRAASNNTRIAKAMPKIGMKLYPGTVEADVVPEIGVDERDIVLGRLHGLGPMTGTDLDVVCRNVGATTIVGVGVSVNVGMLSFGLDAVNLGYQFVLPRQAVGGVPQEYADMVIEHTFTNIGTVVDVDDLIKVWS